MGSARRLALPPRLVKSNLRKEHFQSIFEIPDKLTFRRSLLFAIHIIPSPNLNERS